MQYPILTAHMFDIDPGDADTKVDCGFLERLW